MQDQVYVRGSYHSQFGKLINDTIYSLYEKAIVGVLEDANMEAANIDAVFIGNYSGGGFNKQEHIGPYGVNVHSELRHKPFYRLEAACASGTAALHAAMMALQSGKFKTVAVIGLEKMTHLSNPEVASVLALAGYWPDEGANGFNAPCMFASYANGYMQKYGYSSDQLRNWLTEIASKNYNNAVSNPVAQMRKPRSKQEILDLPDEKNPIIQAPLRLHDCSLISDGSAGIILSTIAPTVNKVAITGYSSATDYLDIVNNKRSLSFLEGANIAVANALKEANLSIEDVQLAEVHDCFTITELLIYSAIGLAKPGEEWKLLEDGRVFPGGQCVVNASGGLKAKGHPIGATGVSMHVQVYKQLIGLPLGLKVNNAENGLVLNIGGSGASNMASVMSLV